MNAIVGSGESYKYVAIRLVLILFFFLIDYAYIISSSFVVVITLYDLTLIFYSCKFFFSLASLMYIMDVYIYLY
jgi:hypothetical protein